MIYEVEITKENVKELIYKEMVRVATAYHRSPQELIAAIILPPGAYKLFEMLARGECRLHIREHPSLNKEIFKFQGIDILCGATPVILSVYTYNCWWCAHEDAKKMVNDIGGIDA